MMAQVSAAKPYKGLGMEGGVARWYAKLTRKALEDFKKDARRVSQMVASSGKVLEVAPGPGYFSIELAKLGDFRVTGLDISQTFVEIARDNAAKAGVRVDFRRGNASGMPFDDAAFDFVFCRAAFKNFTEPVRALQEMHRVLNPRGQAMIIDLRRDASRDALNEAVNQMSLGAVNAIMTKATFRFMLLKRAYTKSEFEQMIAQTPFAAQQIRENLIGLEVLLGKAQ